MRFHSAPLSSEAKTLRCSASIRASERREDDVVGGRSSVGPEGDTLMDNQHLFVITASVKALISTCDEWQHDGEKLQNVIWMVLVSALKSFLLKKIINQYLLSGLGCSCPILCVCVSSLWPLEGTTSRLQQWAAAATNLMSVLFRSAASCFWSRDD